MESVALSAEENFLLVNTTRARHTLAQRRSRPGRVRGKHYVGDNSLRLVRQRPLMVTGDWVTRHLEELREKAAWGVLEVRTLDGRALDLESLSVGALPPDAPMPNFLPDSAENDKPHFGHDVEKFPGAQTIEKTMKAQAELEEKISAQEAQMSSEAEDLFAQAAEEMSAEPVAPEVAPEAEEATPEVAAEAEPAPEQPQQRRGRRR